MPEVYFATELARNLGDILARVKYRHDSFVVERDGTPIARVVPIESAGRDATLGEAPAAWSETQRGEGKPATFNFLGFTHICGKTRAGKFTVLRQTMRQRWQVKLKAIATALRHRLHQPIPAGARFAAFSRARSLGII